MSTDAGGRTDADLSSRWAELAQQPQKTGSLRVVAVRRAHRPLQLTVTPEGWRGLLIPLGRGEVVSIPGEFRPGSSGVLRAEVAQFLSGESAVDALHVFCIESRCNDAFAAFAAFILERAWPDRDLATVLAEGHAEFKLLFMNASGVDRDRLTGLVGELLVLLDGVRLDPGFPRFWAGPRGERHDFRSGSQAIEVKCSLRSAAKAHKVRITDWDQLQAPDAGALFLFSLRLERVENGAFSVASLAKQITELADEPARTEFLATLSGKFASLAHSGEMFSLNERHSYRVIDGFPRLVPAMLANGKPPGVSAVSYELDLDHAAPFKTDWDAAIKALVEVEPNA